ncbi:MAG: thiamine biosynthesis protein ThiS [Euryarchaeota archaeon]|nr:thiamine biosynthesis protein ThiS [Euryarchaeota archaeon]MBF15610.1 thiamine biosynthesis protein ThiS [Chloroflexota bacterium]
MIEILINGEKNKFENSISISELIVMKNLENLSVAVALNSEIVNIKDFKVTFIKNGDKLDIVKPVGGG